MNAKIYNGNVQPNHKEYKIWVNDEGIIKTWNGTEWIEQSGGSGESGGGEDSTVEYLDLANTVPSLCNGEYWTLQFITASLYSKGHNSEGNLFVIPSALVVNGQLENVFWYQVSCVAIDFNETISFGSVIITVKDMFHSSGYTDDKLALIPRITKEEFYNLEA